MILHTASEGVTLAKKLETGSAQFYEDSARRYDTCAEAFHAFAKENRRNVDDRRCHFFRQRRKALRSRRGQGCRARRKEDERQRRGSGKAF